MTKQIISEGFMRRRPDAITIPSVNIFFPSGATASMVSALNDASANGHDVVRQVHEGEGAEPIELSPGMSHMTPSVSRLRDMHNAKQPYMARLREGLLILERQLSFLVLMLESVNEKIKLGPVALAEKLRLETGDDSIAVPSSTALASECSELEENISLSRYRIGEGQRELSRFEHEEALLKIEEQIEQYRQQVLLAKQEVERTFERVVYGQRLLKQAELQKEGAGEVHLSSIEESSERVKQVLPIYFAQYEAAQVQLQRIQDELALLEARKTQVLEALSGEERAYDGMRMD